MRIVTTHHAGFTYMAILFCATVLAFTPAKAQEQWEKEGEGEIKDVEIEITKERQLTLSRANRNFEKIPPRPYEPIKPAIHYEFRNLKFSTPNFNPTIRPLRLKQEEISRTYGNFLSGGFGNYSSIFAEGSATTKRSKDKLLGAAFYLRNFGSGPVDGSNSESSTGRFKLFGKSIGSKATVDGDIHFQKKGTYFYGYDPSLDVGRDKIRQSYEWIGARVGIENTRVGDYNYQVNAGYSYLHDLYKSSESEFTLNLASNYKIKEDQFFTLGADIFLMNYADSLVPGDARRLVRLKPSFGFKPIKKLQVNAGLNLALQNDAKAGEGNFHVYPNVNAKFDLSPSWNVYWSISGDMDKVDLHSFVSENLWVLPVLGGRTNTNREIDMMIKIGGKVGRGFMATGGLAFAKLKDYYFYQNLRDDLNPAAQSVGFVFDKFMVVYDKNTKRLNPFAELSYSHAEVFNLSFRADYFNYSTEVLADAWHRPTYRLDFRARYNIFSKCVVQAGLISQGGMKALDPASNAVVSLDQAIDLNLHTRYFISSKVSAFIQLDNLLASKYPLYLSYPARGFQALVGVSWGF